MYPPPPNDVIQSLKQAVVETVSYGKYIIHMIFESGDRLSFEASFRFGAEAGLADSTVKEFPLGSSDLIRTIGSSVEDISCEEDGTLSMRFSNGDCLIVYANDVFYEAYTLSINGKDHIV